MSKESKIMREHISTHRTVLSMCNEPEDVILNRLLDDFDNKGQRIAELEQELKLCQKLHTELFLAYEKLKGKNEELEEQLKKSFESNNDLLKQVMDLQAQLIKERLKGE